MGKSEPITHRQVRFTQSQTSGYIYDCIALVHHQLDSLRLNSAVYIDLCISFRLTILDVY